MYMCDIRYIMMFFFKANDPFFGEKGFVLIFFDYLNEGDLEIG